MEKRAIFFFSLFALLAILSQSCGGGIADGAVYIPPNGWQILIPDDSSTPPPPAQECQGERPPNIGCQIPCKPCFVFYCENGEWVKEEIEPAPGMCDHAAQTNNEAVIFCPRTPTGYCPPECHYCY